MIEIIKLTRLTILLSIVLIGCNNETTSENNLNNSKITDSTFNSPDNSPCKTDINSIENLKDKRYGYHIAIFKTLNGLDQTTIIDGKLITMFQYSFFPDEDSIYYYLTNRVITDLILKSNQSFYLDFDYKNTPFDNYDYFIYHVKHPKCLNVPMEIYIDSVKSKIIAKSDSTILVKKSIINKLNSRK